MNKILFFDGILTQNQKIFLIVGSIILLITFATLRCNQLCEYVKRNLTTDWIAVIAGLKFLWWVIYVYGMVFATVLLTPSFNTGFIYFKF